MWKQIKEIADMKIKTTLPFLLISILLTGCSLSMTRDVPPPPGHTPDAAVRAQETVSVYPLLPPAPSRGKEHYENECASCHGSTGRADGSLSGTLADKPAILYDPERAHETSLAAWYNQISTHPEGSSMPDYTGVFTDRERWDISAHLYMMNLDSNDLILGKQLYTNNCALCHGELGKGDGPQSSDVTISPPDFSFQPILSGKTDRELASVVESGAVGIMPAYRDIFSDIDTQAVVSYIRSLSFDLEGMEMANMDAATPTPAPILTESVAASTNETTVPYKSGTVTVTGQVVNDTGGLIPDILPVTLRIFDNMEETGSLTSTVQPDGKYLFESVPMSADRIVIASIDYDGQVFNSEPSRLPTTNMEHEAETDGNITLDIHISESTTDTSLIEVERLHIFFDFSREGVVQVVELFLFNNNSDRTVVPADGELGVLSFQLPPEAYNLEFQDSVLGERYLAVEDGFTDTAPVLPGQISHQVLFAFDLPYDNAALITLPMPYPVNAAIVMVPADNVKLESSVLVDGGMKTTQNTTFRVFNGSSLPAGEDLVFNLKGQPATTPGKVGKVKINANLIGGAILMLVIISAGLYIFSRRQVSGGKSASLMASQPVDKNTLMDAIIALDEQYKAGKIQKPAYELRRSELKEQLRKLV